MSARSRWARIPMLALAAGWAVFTLHAALPVSFADAFFNDYLYSVLTLGGALMVLSRGLSVKLERPPWLIMGVGAVLWSLGDVYYTVFLEHLSSPPFPSPADALYLCFYPAAYVALALLIRSRARDARPGLWLDGLIVGLAAGALVAALVLEPILASTHGNLATVATNLAYPVMDMLLLVMAVVAVGLSGWRPSRAWLAVAASLAVSSVADVSFLYRTATNSYVVGRWTDALWPAAMILLALAAWTPTARRSGEAASNRRVFLAPAVAALAALVVLVYGDVAYVYALASGLAGAALLVAVARMVTMLRENSLMLSDSRRMALTDALTGLGNRRMLLEDLAARVDSATLEEPALLVLYDLNGFKSYNDTFGHPAGDALLARLGEKLADAIGVDGTAYRMGGDEFCVLSTCRLHAEAETVALTTTALSEEGTGFTITTSHGTAQIPAEAAESSAALQVADQRLYLQKRARSGDVPRQLRDVLLAASSERHPDLGAHQHGVATLAGELGRTLGMSGEDLDVLMRAAELHDIGKIAVPAEILERPGPLDEEAWAFMRRHTILGERILGAASALRPVAVLVRSSHERYDGDGYPDQIAGSQIPLGSRIIAVCDAYDAMVTDRPYRSALGHAEAVRRLRESTGTQFDPLVVDTFLAHLPSANERPNHDERVPLPLEQRQR